MRPNYGAAPVEVNVTMRILSISSVSEVMMDFTADFYFRQTWRDPRLKFRRLGEIHTLYVGAEVSKRIWLPDTFFGNEKLVSYLIFFSEPNTGDYNYKNKWIINTSNTTVSTTTQLRLIFMRLPHQMYSFE